MSLSTSYEILDCPQIHRNRSSLNNPRILSWISLSLLTKVCPPVGPCVGNAFYFNHGNRVETLRITSKVETRIPVCEQPAIHLQTIATRNLQYNLANLCKSIFVPFFRRICVLTNFSFFFSTFGFDRWRCSAFGCFNLLLRLGGGGDDTNNFLTTF